MPWHILAPCAVACDNLHLRASAHLWHVSAFLCNREFLGISCYIKKAQVFQPELFVRKMGLEPTRCNHHKILSLARLPVPTLPHIIFFDVSWNLSSTIDTIPQARGFVKSFLNFFKKISCLKNSHKYSLCIRLLARFKAFV